MTYSHGSIEDGEQRPMLEDGQVRTYSLPSIVKVLEISLLAAEICGRLFVHSRFGYLITSCPTLSPSISTTIRWISLRGVTSDLSSSLSPPQDRKYI